jgi:hypothetical protein
MERVEKEGTPRAFYPEYAESAPSSTGTPGWDLAVERQLTDGRSLARGLGWFSIGLGLVEVLAPSKVTRFLGVSERHAHLVQLYGLRELTSGIAIMAERTPKTGVVSRLPGDALDLATLGGFAKESSKPLNVVLAMGMVAGITALDAKCAGQLTARKEEESSGRRAA